MVFFFHYWLLGVTGDKSVIPLNASVSPQGGADPAKLHTLSYQPRWRGLWFSALALQYTPGRRAVISASERL